MLTSYSIACILDSFQEIPAVVMATASYNRGLIPESQFRKSDSKWFTRGRRQFLRKSNGYYRNRRNAVGSLS